MRETLTKNILRMFLKYLIVLIKIELIVTIYSVQTIRRKDSVFNTLYYG